MSIFSTSSLGKWEHEYKMLLNGVRNPLVHESTWMLGDIPGLVAIFDVEEVVYIASTLKIASTLRSFHKKGMVNEFRTHVAIFECGLLPKTARERYSSGRSARRVDLAVGRMTFSIAAAPEKHLNALVNAFVVVADPRYNGPTAIANLAIDALPQ